PASRPTSFSESCCTWPCHQRKHVEQFGCGNDLKAQRRAATILGSIEPPCSSSAAHFSSPGQAPIQFLLSCPCGLGGSKFRGWGASQKAFRAQILINVWPMDSVSPSADLPVLPFGFRSVGKPGVPQQGNRNGTPIHEVHAQSVISASDGDNS